MSTKSWPSFEQSAGHAGESRSADDSSNKRGKEIGNTDFTPMHSWVIEKSNGPQIVLPDPEGDEGMGDVLAGILSEIDEDPVEMVREMREP